MNEGKKIFIGRWLSAAAEDLISAGALMSLSPPQSRNVCFHSQQCAGKSLKGFLAANDRHIEKTHDLVDLTNQCAGLDATFLEIRRLAKDLKNSVAGRYPDAWREISEEEAKQAVENAESVFNFVKAKLASFWDEPWKMANRTWEV